MRRLISGTALFLYSCCIIALSVLPIDAPSDVPEHSDKYVHFLIYAAIVPLAVAFFRSCELKTASALIIAVLYSSCLGLLTEYLQTFISYRSFEWADLYVDIFGALTAGVIGYCFHKYHSQTLKTRSH